MTSIGSQLGELLRSQLSPIATLRWVITLSRIGNGTVRRFNRAVNGTQITSDVFITTNSWAPECYRNERNERIRQEEYRDESKKYLRVPIAKRGLVPITSEQ